MNKIYRAIERYWKKNGHDLNDTTKLGMNLYIHLNEPSNRKDLNKQYLRFYKTYVKNELKIPRRLEAQLFLMAGNSSSIMVAHRCKLLKHSTARVRYAKHVKSNAMLVKALKHNPV